MNIDNLIKIIFLMILSTEIGQSLIPVERSALSSVLVDKRIYFLGGESLHSPKPSSTLDQILYLDVSKSFNTVNPPFEEIINVPIPFGSSYATTFLSPQKNVIYLFAGNMVDANTKNPSLEFYKPVLHSYNLETREWTVPTTNGFEPTRRRAINGVINKETGKFYVFGGWEQINGQNNYTVYNDMIVFDTISLTWSKGSTINVPLPRVDYTATLLSNGIIVFIGGKDNNFRDVDINQLALYDTKVDKWSIMTARGVTLENRGLHSAVLTPDERIIIFGGNKDSNEPVLNQLAVLNTKTTPYEWSIPQVSVIDNMPLTTSAHSATLVGNYMFINFGTIPNYSKIQLLPFFYILDIRNFTWITQFEPEESPIVITSVNNSPTNSTNSPDLTTEKSDNGKQIGIIIGTIGLSVGVGTVVGLLGYKYYKKQKYKHTIPTAGSPIN
ncbi:galactose oxidase [Rhizophagus irregularis]|uniref:Galactose oxidase n=1 Tax=Rhizophagus irregularis TaxID=588596 RepID=A0A2I1G2W4_9GLOM|nr:galactose oxidase [Rhizophagus irregularis]